MKPEGQESRNPEDSVPPVNETPEARPVPPIGSMVEPRRSHKGWIIGCLGALLLGISICWFYSQRHVLSESDAHIEMVFKIKPNEDSNNLGEKIPITDEAREQVIEALKNRLKDYGVKHSVMGNGEDLISVKLPSLTPGELKVVRGVLTNLGKLDFRLSHRDSAALIRIGEQFIPGAERMKYEQKGNSGEQFVDVHFILKEVTLKGSYIKSATVLRNDQTGVPEIHFTLDPIGANIFAKITERHRVGNGDERLLAIVVGGNLVSAPSINIPTGPSAVKVSGMPSAFGTFPGQRMRHGTPSISINGRFHSRGQITGDFTFEEAMTLTGSGSVVRKLELMDGSGGWVRKDRSAVTLLSVMPSAFGTFPTFIEQYNPFIEQYTSAASISINGRFHSRGQITGDFTIEEATALANALENQLENQVLLNQVVLIEEKDLK